MDLPGARDLPDPIDVGRAQFETIKRGYDPSEVRSYLTEVAKGLADYRELVKELQRRLASLESQLEASAVAAQVEPTETELTERLGTEAAKVLNAAREAAAEREETFEAEMRAAREQLEAELTEARAEAAALVEGARQQAADLVSDQRASAEAEIAEQHTRAAARLDAQRAAAEDQHRALVAEGEHARAEARAAGRAMVAEAQVVRERILGDLAKRRQNGRRELEQIRAGRDRLLAAFNVANEELSGLLEELTVSLPEARAAAQRAGLSVDLEEVTPEQIERELEAARLIGHPLVAMDGVELDESVEAAEPPDPAEGDEAGLDSSSPATEPADSAVDVLDDDDNLVLAELGARRSRLTRAGRIASQLPTGEIPVLRASPPFEGVRLIDEPGSAAAEAAEANGEPAPTEAAEAAETNGEPAPTEAADDGEVDGAADEPVDDAAAAEVEEPEPELVEDVAGEEVEEEEPVEDVAGEEVEEEEEPELVIVVDDGGAVATDRDADELGDGAGAGDADEPGDRAVPDNGGAVDALFAEVRASRTAAPADDTAAVATLSRADEAVTVLDDDPIATRDRATVALETAVTRALKRALADDQNELLDAARRARSVKSLDDLVTTDTHVGRYVDPVRAELIEAFHAGAMAGGDPAVDTDIVAAEAAIATELVGRLRDELAGVVDLDSSELAEGVRRIARDVRRNRVESTAAHAVRIAYGRGVDVSLGDHRRCWIRDARHDCGLDCEANERAGAVEPGGFDGDVRHPPMFPGCRCVLVRAPQ